MKLLSAVLIMSFVVIFGVGFFAGHRYTANECAPSSMDFDSAQKFVSMVNEEIGKYNKSNSWGYGVTTAWCGPVLGVSAYTFRQKVKIREGIIDQVLSFEDSGFIKEDMEKVRALAKEIAKKIIEAQPAEK